MNITRIWASGLYGYMDFDLSLLTGINLLVGINGAGKTSALNVIRWLTTPDYPSLCLTQYREIGIEFNSPTSKLTSIVATQTGLNLSVSAKGAIKGLEPIQILLDELPEKVAESPQQRGEYESSYRSLRPDPNEMHTWQALEQLQKPLAILLDRRITVSSADSIDIDESRQRSKPIAPPSGTDPLNRVSVIARDRYAQFQSQLIKLNEKLKSKVITSSFGTSSVSRKAHRVTEVQLKAVETKLLARMLEWKTTEADEENSVKKYFERFRKIIKTLAISPGLESKFLNDFFSDEMQRIIDLSDAFNEFDDESSKLFEPVKAYLDCLNVFFKDTGKTLLFSDTNNRLYFNTQKDKEKLLNVSLMSSGERQLLILLTYIAFSTNQKNLFIIDEPELSLHPKWQHQFLPAVEKLMEKNAQLIIATHSPEIVGKYRARCIQF